MAGAIEGLDQVLANLEKASERYQDAAEASIYGQSVALLELVNRKGMVPVNTGALLASNYVSVPDRANSRSTVEVGYGVEYAPKVHEDPSRQGFRKGYKFLEKAVNIHARALDVRLRESTAQNFAEGRKASDFVGAFPTTPTVGAEVSRYQRRYGATKEQRTAMRRLAKRGNIKLVRRWKRPRKGVSRAAMYPKFRSH